MNIKLNLREQAQINLDNERYEQQLDEAKYLLTRKKIVEEQLTTIANRLNALTIDDADPRTSYDTVEGNHIIFNKRSGSR